MLSLSAFVDALAEARPSDVTVSAAVFADALDVLARLAGEQPADACVRLSRYEEAATLAGYQAFAARAVYIRAQATAAGGDFTHALTLIQSAANALRDAGLPGAALRTNLGRTHLLNEMGRHAEALDSCDAIVRSLAVQRPSDLDPAGIIELNASAEVNRGLCFELTSEWDRALDAYGRAEAGFARLDDRTGMAEVIGNRGLVLVATGRIAEAQGALRDAIAMLDPVADRGARCLFMTNYAETLLTCGQYVEALGVLADTGEILDDVDVPMETNDRKSVAARAYEALNLHDEARGLYRDCAAYCAEAGMAVEQARATWGEARVLLATGDPKSAQQQLASVIDTFERSGHRQWLSGAMLDSAVAHRAVGDLNLARVAAETAARLAGQAEAPVEELRAELLLADVCHTVGDHPSAEYSLRRAEWIAHRTEVAPLSLLVDQAIGQRHLESGRLDLARSYLERAAATGERLHAGLANSLVGRRFMLDKLDAFDALVHLALRDHAVDASSARAAHVLAVMERSRARRLGELVAHAREHVDQRSAETASLERELDAVYGEMIAAPNADPNRGERLRARAGDLELALSRAHLDGVRLDTTSESGSTGFDVPLLDETLLSWYCLGDEVVAVVIRDGDVHVQRGAGRLQVVRSHMQRLDAQWQHFRADPQTFARHAARFQRAARCVLADLHDELLAPVQHLLGHPGRPRGVPTALVVAAHGPLHGVPVHALYDGQYSLIERFAVSSTPSVADYLVRSAHKPTVGGALVIGAADALAPMMVDEAKAVAAQLRDVSLHCGESATSHVLLNDAAKRAIVHVACHALFRSDNPMFSSMRLADRWVQARELLGIDLSGALVTLSACDSGRSHAGHGEELVGLTRAVLGAGARSLLASLWPADDTTTVALMTSFYRNLNSFGPADALRLAQLELADSSPHPYNWAPFVLVGGR